MAYRIETYGIFERRNELPIWSSQYKYLIKLWVEQYNFEKNKLEKTEEGTIISVATSLESAIASLPKDAKETDWSVRPRTIETTGFIKGYNLLIG